MSQMLPTKAVGAGFTAIPQETRLARAVDMMDRHARLYYVLPGIVVLVTLYIAPVMVTIYLSFHRWSLSRTRGPVWIGLSNFIELLTSERFQKAALHTFEYTLLAVSIQLILGMAMALILSRPFWGRSMVRTIFLFPMMATPIAAMLAWRIILDPFTGVFSVITSVGGPRIYPPLASETWVIPTLVIVDIWQWTPLVSLILLGGLAALPKEPYEAARIDGASAWQIFWLITVPLLRPIIAIAVLFRLIDALKAFEVVFVLTGGGPNFASETLNIYVYKLSFESFNMGFASAALILYFAIILFFASILIRIRRAR